MLTGIYTFASSRLSTIQTAYGCVWFTNLLERTIFSDGAGLFPQQEQVQFTTRFTPHK